MKNNYKTITIVGLFILLAVVIYILYSKESTKTAFVKNSDLYNEFSLKKELEAKLLTVKNQRKTILDSLMLQLKLSSTELENSKEEKEIRKFQLKKQAYLIKQKEFDEDNQRLAEQYSQQIWKQINQFVNDYGKENGYSFIYGASGDGAIMYAQEKYDITKELIEYTNQKYKGEKK